MRMPVLEYEADYKGVHNKYTQRAIEGVKGLAELIVTARPGTMLGNAARIVKENSLVIGFDFYQGRMGESYRMCLEGGREFHLACLAQRASAVRMTGTGMSF